MGLSKGFKAAFGAKPFNIGVSFGPRSEVRGAAYVFATYRGSAVFFAAYAENDELGIIGAQADISPTSPGVAPGILRIPPLPLKRGVSNSKSRFSFQSRRRLVWLKWRNGAAGED